MTGLRLSDADRDVIARLAQGRSTRQIARELWVTTSAVSMRLMRLRHRAGVATTAALIALLAEQGELPTDADEAAS